MKNCVYSQMERSVGSNFHQNMTKSSFKKKCFFNTFMGLIINIPGDYWKILVITSNWARKFNNRGGLLTRGRG